MSPRLARAMINGLLIGAAAIALFPLLWMFSVSIMSPGEASAQPPPLLPTHATLANYRELFVHAGMGRYLLNSLLVSSAITLLA
ncbi:MAG TPA: carbohydrate ABC transporter permease, partial [Dyella sp.]